MAEALKAAGKRVTVVKLADEDHWLSRTDTRVQMLQAFESFCATVFEGSACDPDQNRYATSAPTVHPLMFVPQM
jgi:hypothetical protein